MHQHNKRHTPVGGDDKLQCCIPVSSHISRTTFARCRCRGADYERRQAWQQRSGHADEAAMLGTEQR